MSAAMTFYTILSLAPMLMIAVAIAGYLYEGEQVQQEIIDQLAQVADQQTVTTVEGLLRNATQPLITQISYILDQMVVFIEQMMQQQIQ